MAEFLIKVADEQAILRQQVEHGYSEAEVHDRLRPAGLPCVLGQAADAAKRSRRAVWAAQRKGCGNRHSWIFNQQFRT